MATVTSTDRAVIGDAVIAVYWMGDEAAPQQYGVCFPGAGFNIARQSLAESMALPYDLMLDNVQAESQREREKVGGPFGVKDACEAVVNTLETKANPTLESFKAVADRLDRILARAEAALERMPHGLIPS